MTCGMLVFTIMTTWHYGLETLCKRNNRHGQQPAEFFARLRKNKVVRVPGVGIFLTRLGKQMPPIIVNYVKQGRSLHETVLALTVSFESVPRVLPRDRLRCEHIGEGLWHVTAYFGFVEIPNLPFIVSRARKEGLPAWDEPTYYIEHHDPISRPSRSVVSRWRIALFAFMSRNSVHPVDRFRIPSDALVEIGRRIEL